MQGWTATTRHGVTRKKKHKKDYRLQKIYNISSCLLHFFQILIFVVNSGATGQKMAQYDKKLCCCAPYLHIISWFLVHMCKIMIISSNFFHFFFQNSFFFPGFQGGVKEQKMTHDYQFQSVTPYISWTVDHILKIFGTQLESNVISRCFSFFLFFF